MAAARRNASSSEKMSRSIESQVEAGLRSFLAKSGVPAIAAAGAGTGAGAGTNNSLDSILGLGGGVGLSAAKGTQIRTFSADSTSLLPPINKDKDRDRDTFLDTFEQHAANDAASSGTARLMDDDEELSMQGNHRDIMLESLLSSDMLLQQQLTSNQSNQSNSSQSGSNTISHNTGNHASGGRKLISQKLVSGTQFRIPVKEPTVCTHCEQFDRQIRKLKETNRMLRLQVARLEEKIHDLRRIKDSNTNANNANGSIADGTDDGLDSDRMRRQSQALETELHIWKKKYIDLDQAKVIVDCSLVTAKKDLLERNDEIARLKQLLADLKTEKEGTERELKLTKEKFMQELELNNRSALKSSEEFSRLELQCKQLKDELDTTKLNLAAKADSYNSLDATMQTLTMQLRGVEIERDKLREKLAKSAQECEVLERSKKNAEDLYSDELARSRNLMEANDQLQKITETIRQEGVDMKLENEKLKNEVRTSSDRTNELLRRMTADSESTKSALERAITSSVRLCVVAPTVNVHIPAGKMNLKSSVSETALREFLSSEVLAKYTFLFKQRAENASPEDGVNIQNWVETMLKNMQTAIEAHVYRAIEGSN